MPDNVTVGELRRLLSGLPDDTTISFEGGLTFSRFKRWSDTEQVLIFNQVQAELSPAFKVRHPEITVAFCELPLDASDSINVSFVPRL